MRISDWSSDVCSSDLVPGPGVLLHAERGGHRAAERGDTGGLRLCRPFGGRRHLRRGQGEWSHGAATRAAAKRRPGRDHHQIGSASWRERVCPYVSLPGVAELLKKKTTLYHNVAYNIIQH